MRDFRNRKYWLKLQHRISNKFKLGMLEFFDAEMMEHLSVNKLAVKPLLAAIELLRDLNRHSCSDLPPEPPIAFARPKWRRRLLPKTSDRRLWETAVLFALGEAAAEQQPTSTGGDPVPIRSNGPRSSGRIRSCSRKQCFLF